MKLRANHRLLWSFVFVISVLVSAQLSQSEEPNIDTLFDPARLVEIEIKMSAKDWSELSRQSRDPSTAFNAMPNINPFTYFKADLWVDGKKIESIGVRKKGFFGSADVQRPSLKIKFEEYKKQKPIPGVTRLTLNNNKQDKSLCSQMLAYQLYRDAGNHAPRSNLAHVTVNGKSLGIYSNVESIGKPFLKSRFGDKSGNLYEGTLTDFYTKSLSKMEKKTNKKEDDSVSVEKFAKLVGGQGEIVLEELESQLNMEAFYRYWAIESLTGFWDGYANNQNNYFVYFDPKDELRGYFIPWGADWLFTESGPFGMSNGPVTVYAQSLLTNRLIKTEKGAERYREAMKDVLGKAWNEKKMISTIDSVEKLVESKLHSAQSDAARSMDQVRGFIRKRRKLMSDALADWSPEIPAEPRKPAYLVEVGTAKGKFSTTFVVGRGSAKSETELLVTRDQKELAIESASASAKLSAPPRFGFGGFGRPGGRESQPAPDPTKQSITLVIKGERENAGPATITLNVPRKLYNSAKDGEAIQVTGYYNQSQSSGGNRGFGGFGGTRLSIVGELRLTQTGQKPGEQVAGEFNLSVVENRGGFASRNNRRSSRGRGTQSGPGRGAPDRVAPQRPTQLSISDALDTNKDGKISASEIDNAARALRMLDKDKDGVLSADEIRKSKVPNRRPQFED